VNAINGIFCLYRNSYRINRLFEHVPHWQSMFTTHEPFGFDEIHMTRAIRELAAEGKVRFKYPPYFGLHSYDRLIQHTPKPNIYFAEDGGLIERFEDSRISPPASRDHFGREIAMFHFSRTKAWPLAA
jgi:hypothetical protein